MTPIFDQLVRERGFPTLDESTDWVPFSAALPVRAPVLRIAGERITPKTVAVRKAAAKKALPAGKPPKPGV